MELTESDKDFLLENKQLLYLVKKNRAISSLDIVLWEKLNHIAAKIGKNSSCNCAGGRIRTLVALADEIKKIEDDRITKENKVEVDTGGVDAVRGSSRRRKKL